MGPSTVLFWFSLQEVAVKLSVKNLVALHFFPFRSWLRPKTELKVE